MNCVKLKKEKEQKSAQIVRETSLNEREKSIKTEWQLQKSQTAIGSLAKEKNTTAQKKKKLFQHFNSLPI